jgi:hypothetical protein
MSEMQCAGVRRDLQSAMCAISKMQCAGVRPWDAVPSSCKTYPCQKSKIQITMYVIIFLIHFFSSSSYIFFNSQHYGEWFCFLLQGEGKKRASTTEGTLGMTNMVQGLRLLL